MKEGAASPFGAELENLIRAAYLANVTPVVKVPENNAAMTASAINLGAKIVEVPKISTREAAAAASVNEAISMGARGLLFGQDDMTMLRNASAKWVAELRNAIEEVS